MHRKMQSFQSLDNNTTQIKNASNESQRDDGISRSSTWQHKCTDSATEPEGQICAERKQISSEEEEEPHEQKTKSNKRVLLVDDEPDTCMVYQIVLEAAGYECKSYTDSVYALEFRPNYYRLILLDVKMPVLNGFELCKKIREVDKTVKIIFITAGEGYYEQLRTQSYPELTNDTNIKYVQKPIANEELIRLVNMLID